MFNYDLEVTAENVIKNLNQMAHDPARDGEKFRLWASGKLGITVVESRTGKTAAKTTPEPAAKTAVSTVFSRKPRARKTADPKKSDT